MVRSLLWSVKVEDLYRFALSSIYRDGPRFHGNRVNDGRAYSLGSCVCHCGDLLPRVGIGGHALDALGSKGLKPWGNVFSEKGLLVLAITSIVGGYMIGIYYMVLYTPLLWLIAIPEGFFLLAYNLEWFHGRFHTDTWFGLSWGGLPVLAGYIIQTNQVSWAVLMVAASMGLLSLVEIKASRPYKKMKRELAANGKTSETDQIQWLESILKSISMGIILLGIGFLTWRLNG